MKALLHIGIIILAAIGFAGVANISYMHLTGESLCPILGVIPACYVIFVAYGMVIISMFLKENAKKVFFIFWLPIILLALLGSIGELTNLAQCPHTQEGTPKCYFSALFSGIIGVMAWFYFKKIKSSKSKISKR